MHAYVALVSERPQLDGSLDDPVWQQAKVVDDFTQVVPNEGARPTFKTEVRFITDNESLFISFRAFDPEPSEIVANLMERDAFLFFDDHFTIVLDTFHDRRNGFFFQVNPNGARRDGTFEGQQFEQNWEGIWFAEAQIDKKGWTAEIEIPFKSLSFRPGANVWGMNMARRVRRLNEDDRWADPSVEQILINVGRAGELIGLAGANQGIGRDVVPGCSIRRIDNPDTNVEKVKFEPSLDAFYKLLPSLTASLTANTNFAGTEVDELQVNLTRFALFFPEKRDFFLQDSGIFNFGGLRNENGIPFFSRRIGLDAAGDEVPLLVGGKISGRLGRYNIGALDILQDSQGGVDKQNLTVARVSANILEQSTAGFIVTHGDPLTNFSNSLVGTDFNYASDTFRGNKTLNASAWVQHSFTTGVDNKQGAWGAQVSYPNDIVRWKIRYKEIQENFDPALGFVNRPGIRRYDADWRYRVRPKNSVWRTIDQKISGTLVTNRENEIESGNIFYTPIALTNQIDDSFQLQIVHLYDRVVEPFFVVPSVGIAPGSYHFPSAITSIRTSRNRKIRLALVVGVGGFYGGWGYRLNPNIQWRPNAHWLLSIELDERQFWGIEAYSRLPDGSLGPLRSADFNSRLIRGRVNIAFTPNVSWNTFVQYDNVGDLMALQSRFRWIIRPGREAFLVLNQEFDTAGGGIRVMSTEPLARVGWTFRF